MTTFAVHSEAEASPAPARRLEVVPGHEHDWRLVQVDYSDGSCVREFACHECSAVWFA